MAKKKTTEQSHNDGVASSTEDRSPLIVNAQYIKDLSFENPAPLLNLMGDEEKPAISIHIEARANTLSEKTFEVVLHIQVDAKGKSEQVFLLDLQYGGIFTIGEEVPDEYLRPILMIECPRILFPFARHIISTTTQEGGYPALMLTPVDFADLYQRQVAQEEAQKEKGKSVLQ